jgi:membrane protease YdiL (CAAX protease family)
MWVLAGAVVWLVLRWERRPLSSIGLERPSGRLVLLAVGVGVGVTAAGLVITGALVSLSVIRQPPEGLAVLGELSTGHRVVLVVTAAVTEEILYRGYPIERLGELTSLWLGAAIAGTIFLAVHFPFWGPAAVPMQATATVGLVGLYVWKRNLPAAMIAHATIDTLLLLVLPALI